MVPASGEEQSESGRRESLLDPEAHVLVVDDDREIRQLIARFLGQYGYHVSGARDGTQMQDVLATSAVDVIILDLMLPGTSGLDLCRELRARSTVPIVMLTAKSGDTDRIVGLEVGADDYISKPFNPRELLARIRAVLRRAAAHSAPTRASLAHELTFAGWTLDIRGRELRSSSGVVVDLSAGEYDLLLAFLEHPQRVLSRDQLLDLARNRTGTGYDRSIDVQVSRLRRKLNSDDSDTALIKTIRGVGYIFTPLVKRQ